MRIVGLGCLASCLALLACEQDVSKPSYEYSPDMAYSLAYESFSANPHFADGKTLAAPPPGTIPQGYQPFHASKPAKPEEALESGEVLRDPLPMSAEADKQIRERGKVLYDRFCLPCHGLDFQGGGLVTRLYSSPPPLLAEGSNSLSMKDGQLFHIISVGQGNMPGYGQQISQQDRWKLIRYIRSVQKPFMPPPPAPANTDTDTPSQGAL